MESWRRYLQEDKKTSINCLDDPDWMELYKYQVRLMLLREYGNIDDPCADDAQSERCAKYTDTRNKRLAVMTRLNEKYGQPAGWPPALRRQERAQQEAYDRCMYGALRDSKLTGGKDNVVTDISVIGGEAWLQVEWDCNFCKKVY